MIYASLFAGIGGFDLALNRLGHTAVYVNEWDKYACDTYERRFGHRPDSRDITTVPESDIPDHDILCGGFPCQAFSVAGKRRGFEESRGTLFFDIARIARAKRPAYLFLENVKGLLSHDGGRTFEVILRTIDELGYDVQWHVVNSKNFGVPQNRERIIIIGHLRGHRRPQVFPITPDDYQDHGEAGQGEISGTIDTGYAKNHRQSGATYIAPTLRATDYKNGDTQTAVAELRELTRDASQGYRVYDPSGIATTIASQAGGIGAKTGLYAVPLKFLDRNQRNYQGDYSFTVDTVNSGGIMKDMQIRRLTPTECERLQGFPDGWTEGVSDTQRYKQLGNAVTVNVIHEIAKRAFSHS